MCLIKRIPLKSAMECWISFVSNACDNRGKAAWRVSVRKLEMFDRQHGGHTRHKARKTALSSSRQHKERTVVI